MGMRWAGRPTFGAVAVAVARRDLSARVALAGEAMRAAASLEAMEVLKRERWGVGCGSKGEVLSSIQGTVGNSKDCRRFVAGARHTAARRLSGAKRADRATGKSLRTALPTSLRVGKASDCRWARRHCGKSSSDGVVAVVSPSRRVFSSKHTESAAAVADCPPSHRAPSVASSAFGARSQKAARGVY
jgi:hypothetical protein